MNEDEKEKEFLVLAVKLLFKRIREGKVTFAEDRMPETIKALHAVTFDKDGNPVYETITPPVRSLANVVFTLAVERFEEEALERERNSPVHKVLWAPVQVSDELLKKFSKEGQFSALAFELYKETGCVVSVAANCHMGTGPTEGVFDRNQAICAGLLIRILKFMTTVAQLSAKTHRGEVIMALNRSIFESATNLRFMVMKNEARFYDQFVKFSLAPERELYDLITKNIEARGGEVLPIEDRMLASVHRVCKLSGVKIEDLDSKYRDWGGGMRNRLEALGEPHAYVLGQRIASHAVHGTWADLLFHHLEAKEGGFVPNPEWTPVDERYLGPAGLAILRAVRDYLNRFLGDIPEIMPLYARIDDLQQRILKTAKAHEEWLESSQEAEDGRET